MRYRRYTKITQVTNVSSFTSISRSGCCVSRTGDRQRLDTMSLLSSPRTSQFNDFGMAARSASTNAARQVMSSSSVSTLACCTEIMKLYSSATVVLEPSHRCTHSSSVATTRTVHVATHREETALAKTHQRLGRQLPPPVCKEIVLTHEHDAQVALAGIPRDFRPVLLEYPFSNHSVRMRYFVSVRHVQEELQVHELACVCGTSVCGRGTVASTCVRATNDEPGVALTHLRESVCDGPRLLHTGLRRAVGEIGVLLQSRHHRIYKHLQCWRRFLSDVGCRLFDYHRSRRTCRVVFKIESSNVCNSSTTGRSRCFVVWGHRGKRRGRVVTSGQFLKKGLPGRVDTSGTKTTIKTGKLWKCDLP